MGNISRRSFLCKTGIGIGTTAMYSLPSFIMVPDKKEKSDTKKLNIALVGLGNYAGALAYGLENSKYCRLAAIVTGHPEKANEWKKQYGIPDKNIYNYQNFDEIKNNRDIDLVYVVLPNSMHKEFTVRAAKAGKHVICEKPMATSSKDCMEMIKACKDAGVQLAIGYRLHYEPYHKEIKRLGQEKIFGQVRFIEAGLGYKVDDGSNWRFKKAMAGGGPLMDLGVYCVQSCRYVLGEEPIAVSAQYGPNTNKKIFSEVEASIAWQFEFPGGTFTNCISSYNANVDRFFASADEGQFELSPGLSHGPFKGKTSKGELSFPDINQQATQLDEIGKLILDYKPLSSHITGEEGLKDILIIEGIYRAAESGKKIALV